MRKNVGKREGRNNTADSQCAQFQAVLQAVAARTGATDVNFSGTPISVFKTHVAAILRRVKTGSIEVVTQNGVPFVILSVEQVSRLLANKRETRMAHELLDGLPSVSGLPSVPRSSSVLKPAHHRVPRTDKA